MFIEWEFDGGKSGKEEKRIYNKGLFEFIKKIKKIFNLKKRKRKKRDKRIWKAKIYKKRRMEYLFNPLTAGDFWRNQCKIAGFFYWEFRFDIEIIIENKNKKKFEFIFFVEFTAKRGTYMCHPRIGKEKLRHVYVPPAVNGLRI